MELGVCGICVASACAHARHTNDTHAFPQTTLFVVSNQRSLRHWSVICLSQRKNVPPVRRVKSTPDSDPFEKYSNTPPISIAIPICKKMPSSWQKVAYKKPPVCITIRLPCASRYLCRSTRVRSRWNTPKSLGSTPPI